VSEDSRTDAELVTDSTRGDGAAFGVLVYRHIRSATLLATQLLGDQDDAEDVVQDAFTIVLRRARHFDPKRPFPPWLFAIVRRLASNRRSREIRRARLLRRWSAGMLGRSPASDAHNTVAARLDSAAVLSAMGDLSPMQRACFELVVLRNLSTEEVAAMHGISESTVRQHVFRARAALRAAVQLPSTRSETP
jgi:RNA polymerase sigma-70 factor (ECF subfamily)